MNTEYLKFLILIIRQQIKDLANLVLDENDSLKEEFKLNQKYVNEIESKHIQESKKTFKI